MVSIESKSFFFGISNMFAADFSLFLFPFSVAVELT